MTHVADCPDLDTLAQFLLGHTVGPDIEAHVSECPACGERLATVAAEDELVATMRAGAVPTDPLAAHVIDGVLTAARTDGWVGPYRIAEELGKGGMGVVYRAEDSRLGRTVAIKRILDARLCDGHALARFEAEARAMARLRHPGIVQIHEVGHDRGRPFLVMEYVAGGTLARRLAGQVMPVRDAAALVRTLADAVQHAHEHGVLHRDLKPSNVLMDGPAPRVSDFGLARHADDGGLTHTGDVLGTPGYMAPEVAAGRKVVGPAADVHSLGAILYECLTGRPPYRGETALETLDQVRTLDPVPPRRLRPGLARDLETVCLTCLHKDPARRYPSAAALADDLRRFLDGVPIAARRPGLLTRSLAWARRRPAIAALSALCVALGVALGVGAVVHERELRRALNDAKAQKERAEEGYKHARETLRKMQRRATDPRWDGVARMQALRQGQTEDALAFYVQTAQRTGDDPLVRADVAWALTEAAKLRHRLGQQAEAAADLDRAVVLIRGLIAQQPDIVDHRLLLADALLTQGANGGVNAVAQLDEAVDVLSDRPEARRWLANVLITRGAVLAHARPADAEADLLRAIALLDVLAEHDPDGGHDLARAKARVNLCSSLRAQKKPVQPHHDWAVADLEAGLKRTPDDAAALDTLAVLRINRGYDLGAERRFDDAIASVSLNLPPLEAARRREPDQPRLTDLLYRTCGVRATLLEQAGRPAEAAADWEHVIALGPPAARPAARVTLVLLRLAAGDHRRAADAADAAAADLTAARDDQYWGALASAYRRAGELAEKDARLTDDERRGVRQRCAAGAARMSVYGASASVRKWWQGGNGRPR